VTGSQPQTLQGVGAEAGGIGSSRRYRIIGIDRRHYREHRLASLYMTGEWAQGDIDHKDRDGTNNRWSNLRLAPTRAHNNANSLSVRNKIGLKGIVRTPVGKYLARIAIEGRRRHLGHFVTAREAHGAYRAAALAAFGEFLPSVIEATLKRK
jgi:hypothetical protein